MNRKCEKAFLQVPSTIANKELWASETLLFFPILLLEMASQMHWLVLSKRKIFFTLFHRIIRAIQFPWIHALLIAQIHENISFPNIIVWFNKFPPIYTWLVTVLTRVLTDFKSLIGVTRRFQCFWLSLKKIKNHSKSGSHHFLWVSYYELGLSKKFSPHISYFS